MVNTVLHDNQIRKTILEFMKKRRKATLDEIKEANDNNLIQLPSCSNYMTDDEIEEYLLIMGIIVERNEKNEKIYSLKHVDDDPFFHEDFNNNLKEPERTTRLTRRLSQPQRVDKVDDIVNQLKNGIMIPSLEEAESSTPKRKRDEIQKTSRRIQEAVIINSPKVTRSQAQVEPKINNPNVDNQIEKPKADLTRAEKFRRSQRIQIMNVSKQTAASSSTVSSNFPAKKKIKLSEISQGSIANIKGYVLVGDDNMVNLANYDLHFPIKNGKASRRSGYCKSGLKIREACDLIKDMKSIKKIIINVGAVDILEDEPLINIVEEYRRLIRTCKQKKISTILTTLPPLPSTNLQYKHEALKAFNKFILDQKSQFPIINLNKCFVSAENNSIDFNYYQVVAKKVKGTKETFILWNKPGRSRVLKMLTRHIGFADIYKSNYVGDNF